MTIKNNAAVDPGCTTAITAEELDFYKAQIAIEAEKYKLSHTLWPGTSTTFHGAIRQLPFKEARVGGEQILETRCNSNELKDYFVLGNIPQEGHTYSLVCVKVIDDNGQIVARFKLV